MAGLASWVPGQAVGTQTPLKPVCDTLSVGQFDQGYSKIGIRLGERSCHTVGQLIANYDLGELLALVRALVLTKAPKIYVMGLSQTIHHTFVNPAEKEEKKRGGNTSTACTKLAPSVDFNHSRYSPDGRVYKDFPTNDVTTYLSDAEAKMLLDFIWLEAQSIKEKSYGEYLPDGMAKRLAYIHRLLKLPDFRPFHHKTTREKARPAYHAIQITFQNHRQGSFKRIVLDEKFRGRFGEKVVKSVRFVESDSEELQCNARNALFSQLVDVADGVLPVPLRS